MIPTLLSVLIPALLAPALAEDCDHSDAPLVADLAALPAPNATDGGAALGDASDQAVVTFDFDWSESLSGELVGGRSVTGRHQLPLQHLEGGGGGWGRRGRRG